MTTSTTKGQFYINLVKEAHELHIEKDKSNLSKYVSEER